MAQAPRGKHAGNLAHRHILISPANIQAFPLARHRQG